MTRSPPTTSRLRRLADARSMHLDGAVVGDQRQELAVARPADRGGQTREQNDWSIELRREHLGCGAAVRGDDEHVVVGVPAVVDLAGEGDRLAIRREDREGDATLSVREPSRPAPGGGQHPCVAPELTVVATRAAVGREHDRGAVRGERGVVVVVIAAGELPGRSARDVHDEQMPAAVLPADPVEARRETPHDPRRVAIRGTRLGPIRHPDATHDDDPRRVRRPRELADRAWEVAEPCRHAPVERRQAHVRGVGPLTAGGDVREPAAVRGPARALVRGPFGEPARRRGAVERRHPHRRARTITLHVGLCDYKRDPPTVRRQVRIGGGLQPEAILRPEASLGHIFCPSCPVVRSSVKLARAKSTQSGRTVARLGERELDVTDAPLGKAGLAVLEVQRPKPPKALVISKVVERFGVRGEVPLPAPECLDVVRGQVLEPDRLHVGAASDVAGDHLERGQAAAREDVGVDERPRRLLDLVGAVVDRDRLEQHRAVVREEFRALREERTDVAPADGLDHLDRDELVVASGQVAVVAEEHRDPILQPGPADNGDRVVVLLARDRGRRDPATARRSGVDGQGSPPRPDLEQVVPRAKVEPVADQLELGQLGVLERRRALGEHRARVAHRPVEHPREQLVAKVVVGGDVAPAPIARAAS